MIRELEEYEILVQRTDRLPESDLRPAMLGLFGEVGEVLTTAKKLVRESTAYKAFRTDALEEFGDALWYFAAVCRRAGISLSTLMVAAAQRPAGPGAGNTNPGASSPSDLHDSLLRLMHSCATIDPESVASSPEPLRCFARSYLSALDMSGLSLDEVVSANTEKISGRFLDIEQSPLLRFDDAFPEDERLPDEFVFKVTQRPSGQCYLSLNGVFVGDALTDNILEPDGYRFHDVFHMANAAVLHWSPVLRALLKRKRKSNPRIDEAQDGGRAIVIEEGLTAWLFARAKPYNYFEGADSVSFDILKRIDEFVTGYEVDHCTPALWERSILQGFAAFRALAKQKSGFIIGNRMERTIRYSEHG